MSKELKMIIGLIAGFLTLSLISWLPTPKPQDFFRLVINCIFCFFLFKGHAWARWVMGVLSALACATAFASLRTLPAQLEILTIVVVMGAFYGFAAFILLSGKFIRGHFKPASNHHP